MAQHVFVAPIFIAVAADSEAEASDALAETLRGLMIHGQILDWQYAKDPNGQYGYAGPTLVGLTVAEAEDEEVCNQHAYDEAIKVREGQDRG